MGTYSYIICEERKEVFELGRGAWSNCYDDLSEESIKEDLKDILYDRINGGFLKRAATKVIKWCSERDWGVHVMSDASSDFPELDDYKVSGELFDGTVNLSKDDIQTRMQKVVSNLFEELGADSVQVVVSFIDEDEVYDAEEDEYMNKKICWEHVVHVGENGKFSGYIKRYKK